MTKFQGEAAFAAQAIVWSPQRLWQETGNPLIAWEVIDQHLSAGQSLPEWCVEYLKRLASAIVAIEQKPGLSPAAERAAVWRALEFGRQGKQSAYRALRKLRDSVNVALSPAASLRSVTRTVALRKKRTARRRWDV